MRMLRMSRFMGIFQQADDYQIDDARRDGEERAVEAVHHAPVSGDDVAGVLDLAHALPLGFEQVAEHACDVHDDGQDDGVVPRIGPESRPDQDEARQDGEDKSAPEACPGLFRGDALKEFLAVFAEKHSDTVGAHVGGPDDDEEGEHRAAVEVAGLVQDHEAGEREGRRDVQQARVQEGEELEISFVLDHQRGDHQHEQQDGADAHQPDFQPEGQDEEQGQERAAPQHDGQGARPGEQLPHRHAVELVQHRHHHESDEGGVQVLVHDKATDDDGQE